MTTEEFRSKCGLGWEPIVKDLLNKIGKEVKKSKLSNFRVLQIKEKFGDLCFYVSGSNDAIYELIYVAAKKASVTCEDCGNPAEKRVISDIVHPWYRTQCSKCFTKREAAKEKNFVEFMQESPLYGADIDLSREQTSAGLEVKIKYIKCRKCGWVHFIQNDIDAPWSCFHCGNDDRKTLVRALKKDVLRVFGSTIQPINRRVKQNEHVSSNLDKIQKQKLHKQMKKASQDPMFIEDLKDSMKALEAADTKTTSRKEKRNKHVGSNFDDFLEEEGTVKESEAVVAKRVAERATAMNDPAGPGEILLELFLKPRKISQARLAKETGIPKKH
ncbi:MAG: helix-turn-helix transcriptional regulator, partial [Dissulfurispiraceae bacterium]